MKTSKAQLEAHKRYIKSKDRIQVIFPAGTRKDIEKYLEVSGCVTVGDFIRDCVITRLCEYNLQERKKTT